MLAPAIAQEDSPMNNLQQSAKKMFSLFIAKEYPEYVEYIHPTILAMMGGKEKMVEGIKASLEFMEADSIVINNVTIGTIKGIIRHNNELQAVVPQVIELNTQEGRLVSTGYLLAFSTDNGKTWLFSDTSGKNAATMRKVFPNLSKEIVIPAKKQPVLYKD